MLPITLATPTWSASAFLGQRMRRGRLSRRGQSDGMGKLKFTTQAFQDVDNDNTMTLQIAAWRR
jgi:hypothetical protein